MQTEIYKSESILVTLRREMPEHINQIVDQVWNQKGLFLQWPARAFLFMPGSIRNKYHKYTADQKRQIRDAELKPDGRSNGPAIMAYLLAGGERPARHVPGRQWSVHHIYDGKHPASGRKSVLHAVKDGRFFTEAAGLVAIHPIADALADDIPYFSWLLRYEAFKRFEFDPEEIFRNP